jgi:mRNA-degrading endonuclease YafQ of YafQ-DinJ toxin-antitoxin module
MLEFKTTNQFDKDLKRNFKRGKDENKRNKNWPVPKISYLPSFSASHLLSSRLIF